MEEDKLFMQKAIDLAKQGRGRTFPHPMTGTVIVNNGEIVGEGFYSGKVSSEFNALEAAEGKTEGATLYTVVEPSFCKESNISFSQYIKTKGIKRVVIAMENPNSNIGGKVLRELFDFKINISLGIEDEKAKKLNETFIKYSQTKLPFVNIVTSMTLDGKTSTSIGDREEIISNESNAYLHELRARYEAVMVNVDMIIRYNTALDCKVPNGHEPIKIIIDSYAKTPINSKIFRKKKKNGDIRSNIIVVVSHQAPEKRIKMLQAEGAEIVICSDEEENLDSPYADVNLKKLIFLLGKRNITSLLVEGDGNLNSLLLDEKFVDKYTLFLVPKIVGGKESLTPVEGNGISLMSQAIDLKNLTYKYLGKDLLLKGYIE